MNRLFWSRSIVLVALPLTSASAATITFENVAPAGGLVNVNVVAPYTEGGFTLSPSGVQSAVFDSAAAVDFPGDATDFFGFAEINLITLTAPAPFILNSLLIGPTTASSTPAISMTLLGTSLWGWHPDRDVCRTVHSNPGDPQLGQPDECSLQCDKRFGTRRHRHQSGSGSGALVTFAARRSRPDRRCASSPS